MMHTMTATPGMRLVTLFILSCCNFFQCHAFLLWTPPRICEFCQRITFDSGARTLSPVQQHWLAMNNNDNNFYNDGDENDADAKGGKTPTNNESSLLQTSKNADDKKDGVVSTVTANNNVLVVAVAGFIAFTAFWPFLAWVRYENPISYFDIDTYLALKGVMANDPGMMTNDTPEILELPGLSPAEQLVAAFFGPPVTPPNR